MKVMLLKPNLKKSIAPMLIFLGIGMLLFGVQNIYSRHLVFYSPFDQAAPAAIVVVSKSAFETTDKMVEDDASFLPILQQIGGEDTIYAPEFKTSAKTQSQYIVDNSTKLIALKVPVLENAISDFSLNERQVLVPERLVIPAIAVDALVVPVFYRGIEFQGEKYNQWTAPSSEAVGWHSDSAFLGVKGNTVINGHNSGYNEIFRFLEEVQNGDFIQIYSGSKRFDYVVANTMILNERFEPQETRLDNAKWINPSHDERLTLISCWPYGSNTHRVVVVAIPVGKQD